jgi:hypothetical protein
MVFQIWVCLKMGYTQKWPLNRWENDEKTWILGVPNFQTKPYLQYSKFCG